MSLHFLLLLAAFLLFLSHALGWPSIRVAKTPLGLALWVLAGII